MDGRTRLLAELSSALRGMKDLSAHAIEVSDLRIELAGAHVLGRLSALGPVRLTALACALGLDPSSVSRQVTSLERSGWVRREDDPDDRRATRLHLTPAGQEVVDQISAVRAASLARVTPDWTDTDLDALADQLARLNHDLDDHRTRLDARLENA